MFLILFLVGTIFFFTGNSQAQNWFGLVNYQVSFPFGDTQDYIGKTSFRGFGLDFRKALDPSTTVGFTFGWNVFYERITGTIEIQTDNPGAVTGIQDRYINAFPVMLNAHRYFGPPEGRKFFIGLAAGGFIMSQRLGIGIFEFQKDEWQWGMAPEIGIAVPVGHKTLMVINGKYNYAFTGKDVTGASVHHQFWTLGIGFAWGD